MAQVISFAGLPSLWDSSPSLAAGWQCAYGTCAPKKWMQAGMQVHDDGGGVGGGAEGVLGVGQRGRRWDPKGGGGDGKDWGEGHTREGTTWVSLNEHSVQ